jgi:aldehyde dehydrogenase (NAD+)
MSTVLEQPTIEGRNYINGEFITRRSGDEYQNINPATGESLGAFPQSTPGEVSDVYGTARTAFNTWKAKSRVERCEYMYRVAHLIEERREKLARIISLETGKNFNESIAEVNEALHMAQFAFGSGRTPTGDIVSSELAEKDSYMVRKPKGVIAIVSPFNFPLAIGPFWCAAPALVEGNTVIIKPSEDAPWSTQAAVQLYHDAGLPAGVLNVVHGDGLVGNLLVHEDVDHICFTGSAEVGQKIRRVAAESWHKTTSCEMGSKSACIVFDDADVDMAVDAAVASAFKLSGQRCVSSGRMIIQRGVYDEFCSKFVEKTKHLITGDPFNLDGTPSKDNYYGPLINKQGLDKLRQYNKYVLEDDQADVLIEPRYFGPEGVYFATPCVYKTEWRGHEAPYLRNEVFGPHVALIPFDTVEEGVKIYNDTEYGLAVGILTNNYRTARYCRDNCDTGMCYWNGGSIAAESHLSFGGVKKSGNGFPSAAKTWQAVTHTMSWTVNHGEDIAFPQGMSK